MALRRNLQTPEVAAKNYRADFAIAALLTQMAKLTTDDSLHDELLALLAAAQADPIQQALAEEVTRRRLLELVPYDDMILPWRRLWEQAVKETP